LVRLCPEIIFVQQLYPQSPVRIPSTYPAQTHTFRDACGVVAAAQAYVRGESGMCHAAAALGVPTVTIWGGCMDWDVLGSYPKQTGVGILTPPCGSFKPCRHCMETMAAITPETVAVAVRQALADAAAASPLSTP
jgi:ADP-heptose:LPS heptosyltransferase